MRATSTKYSGGGTLIGPETSLSGDISGDGTLTVQGEVLGDVLLGGDLTVTVSGVVDGDVDANRLSLDGKVLGKVKAREAVLGPQAHLSGGLSAPNVSIHPKARVDARLDMPLNLPRQVGSVRR